MNKIVIWVPVIVMFFVIFGFSGQNGNESGGLSRKAAAVILHAADSVHIVDVTPENEQIYIENLQFPIRKAAHMTEYAVLGILCLIAFLVDGITFWKSFISSFVMTFCLAGIDEFHQLFVPGRSGQFTDVLIDSTGCLIGLIMFCIVYKCIIRHKTINS